MFEKIKASDGNEYTKDAIFTDSAGDRIGVIGQDTTPNLSASEMQYSVEAVVREVVIPAYNSLVDALNALAAASNMGAADINGDASTVQAELTKRIITGNVKYIRLNSDKVLETSNDGVTWESTGPSGHIIIKPDGTVAPQRSRMKFANGTVTDDGTQTIITALKGDTGPQGPAGVAGADGKSAYQTAVEGGYSGTETAFNEALASINTYRVRKATVTLPTASWENLSQAVIISGVTVNSKVDIQMDATALGVLIDSGTSAIWIENDNGTLTAKALGEKPNANLSVQVTITEVSA